MIYAILQNGIQEKLEEILVPKEKRKQLVQNFWKK